MLVCLIHLLPLLLLQLLQSLLCLPGKTKRLTLQNEKNSNNMAPTTSHEHSSKISFPLINSHWYYRGITLKTPYILDGPCIFFPVLN